MHLSKESAAAVLARVYLERADCTPDSHGNDTVFGKWSGITLGVLAFKT
jgi:hypothetical protein